MDDVPLPRTWEESVDVLGRRFVLLVEGPVPPGRYEIRIWEGRRGSPSEQYLRAPIRGRDPEEARERAIEVLHNYVGLDQFRLLAEEVAAELTPGARVEVRETARAVVISLAGAFTLTAPLVVPRDEVLAYGPIVARLRDAVRAHLSAHALRS